MELIIIIAIIWFVVKRSKSASTKQTTVPNQPRPQTRPTYSQQRPMQNASYGQQRPVQNAYYNQQRTMQNTGYNQQRPAGNAFYGQQASGAGNVQQTKARLQQKYGNRSSAYGTNYQQQTLNLGQQDILSRAKSNVKENEIDQAKVREQQIAASMQTATQGMVPGMHSAACACGPNAPVGKDSASMIGIEGIQWESETMKEVNDLMIMGYSGSLTFERDFVAEGVEMLNRFAL